VQRAFIILVATCVMSGLWGQVASAQVVDEQRRREAFKYYRAGEEFMYAESWEKAIPRRSPQLTHFCSRRMTQTETTT